MREMACRLNRDGKNFDKAADNLGRTAQVQISGEALRVLVETEGKQIARSAEGGTSCLSIGQPETAKRRRAARGSTSAVMA